MGVLHELTTAGLVEHGSAHALVDFRHGLVEVLAAHGLIAVGIGHGMMLHARLGDALQAVVHGGGHLVELFGIEVEAGPLRVHVVDAELFDPIHHAREGLAEFQQLLLIVALQVQAVEKVRITLDVGRTDPSAAAHAAVAAA